MTRRSRSRADLAEDDQVVLFPSLAHKSRDGQHWVVDVHGDVFAPGKIGLGQRVLLRLLRRSMRASCDDLASPIFQARIARFAAHNRPGRRIDVQIGPHLVAQAKTRRNGHFQIPVRIPVSAASELARCELPHEAPYLPLEVGGAGVSGRAYLVEPTGLSIISDIDDTLKHSQVECKRTLLTNTFLRPYVTIAGMSRVFCRWAAAGAAIHYVSSSPWQLYGHLAEHLAGEGFPAGSFHLRSFRLRDHLLRRLLMLRRSGKQSVIRALLSSYPHRRFLLVGDSGEHDPEIYGALARRFPQQVIGICIRQLAGVRDAERRYARAFRGLDPALIQRFESPDELPSLDREPGRHNALPRP